MIASLYQHASSSAAEGAWVTAAIGMLTCGTSMAIDAQDVSLADVGIEPHVVPLATPFVLHVVQEIADGEGLVGGDAGHADMPVLHVMRIQVHDGQQAIGTVRCD